jgi:hypothetical protein
VLERATTIGQRQRDISKYCMVSHGARAQPARSPGDAWLLAQLGAEARRAEYEAALKRGRELYVRGRVVRRGVEV